MFTLMFLNEAGEMLFIKDKYLRLLFPTYESAYATAHQLLTIMANKGAVKMIIDHRDGSCHVRYEYPILDD